MLLASRIGHRAQDALLVVLAARHRVRDELTLDRRRFNAMRQLNGRPFRVLP